LTGCFLVTRVVLAFIQVCAGPSVTEPSIITFAHVAANIVGAGGIWRAWQTKTLVPVHTSIGVSATSTARESISTLASIGPRDVGTGCQLMTWILWLSTLVDVSAVGAISCVTVQTETFVSISLILAESVCMARVGGTADFDWVTGSDSISAETALACTLV
jgi:hypothetical protein